MDYLKPYDQATVALWRRGHTELACQTALGACLIHVAVHAVLAGLRPCSRATAPTRRPTWP